MEHVESVSLGLWFRVGSRYEPAVLHGAAHFLEHMLFKGTKRRTSLQISESVESVGGDLNAFTTEEMTCYYARVGSDYLPQVLDVLFDMVQESVFSASEFERERGVIQEELRMYDDQPQVVVSELLQKRIWSKNSLGRPVAGTTTTIANLKRKELIGFWRKNYHPGSMVISLAGEIDVPCVMDLVKRLQSRPVDAAQSSRWNPVKPVLRKQVEIAAESRPVQQANLALGARGFSRQDPRRFAQKVLSVLLGENSSSRLFQSIREKHGLAYSVQSSITQFHETGAFAVQMGLDSGQVPAALKLLAKELQRTVKRPPTSGELQRAKDYAIGQLKLSLESTSNQMMWMGESMIGMGRIVQPREVIDSIRSVTAVEVQKIAADLFQPGRITLACISADLNEAQLKPMAACLGDL
jgi:predicted Zn-dependent peptidase